MPKSQSSLIEGIYIAGNVFMNVFNSQKTPSFAQFVRVKYLEKSLLRYLPNTTMKTQGTKRKKRYQIDLEDRDKILSQILTMKMAIEMVTSVHEIKKVDSYKPWNGSHPCS